MRDPRLFFNLSAGIELVTGIALLAAPDEVILLLLGSELAAVGLAITHILGMGLLALGVTAWQTAGETGIAPRAGICLYNVGAGVLLALLGVFNGFDGTLLWPASILHFVIGVLLAWFVVKSLSLAGNVDGPS